MTLSQISIYGENPGECGYCKDNNTRVGTSISYGITSSHIYVEDYEELMLIGWRRSGNYFYKPIMYKTCCPQYTIRLPVNNFQISKSQRQILRRIDRYLYNGDIHQTNDINSNTNNNNKYNISITTEKSNYTIEKYELYRKYQTIVHNDSLEEITIDRFKSFLVDSPLVSKSQSDLYGTFHQLYRIDDQLIAVGVLDILPSGISSVYLFYDPDHRHLVLGKYTALKEIEYCRSRQLSYYYMGFYIHSCIKMRYKGEYSPSELLCPVTLQWYPLTDSIKYLSIHKFTPLDPILAEERSNNTNNNDLSLYKPRIPELTTYNHAMFSYHNNILRYQDLNSRGKELVLDLIKSFYQKVPNDMIDKLVIKLD